MYFRGYGYSTSLIATKSIFGKASCIISAISLGASTGIRAGAGTGAGMGAGDYARARTHL